MAHQFGYILCKVKVALLRKIKGGHPEKTVFKKFFEKHGVTIGDNCCIYSNILSSESFLIHIGDDVTISNDVQLLTHDNSIDKVCEEFSDLLGKIKIGNNCFIGAHSLIMPGVTLADNIIVGGGSVITKSFTESYIVIAGNPARKISTWESFYEKNKDKAFHLRDGARAAVSRNPERVLEDK